MTHELVFRNAQEMAKSHAAGFSAPGLELVETLPIGSLVKVCAVLENNRGERFWVRVTDKDGEVWTGNVANSLVYLKVAYGDRVRFSPVNVYDFKYPEEGGPS